MRTLRLWQKPESCFALVVRPRNSKQRKNDTEDQNVSFDGSILSLLVDARLRDGILMMLVGLEWRFAVQCELIHVRGEFVIVVFEIFPQHFLRGMRRKAAHGSDHAGHGATFDLVVRLVV